MYIHTYTYIMHLRFSFNLNFCSDNYLYRSVVHALGTITQGKKKKQQALDSNLIHLEMTGF